MASIENDNALETKSRTTATAEATGATAQIQRRNVAAKDSTEKCSTQRACNAVPTERRKRSEAVPVTRMFLHLLFTFINKIKNNWMILLPLRIAGSTRFFIDQFIFPRISTDVKCRNGCLWFCCCFPIDPSRIGSLVLENGIQSVGRYETGVKQ